MVNIPRHLYTKKIKEFISYIVSFELANNFDELDELDKDRLMALGIGALDGDIDITLSTEANLLLTKFLSTHDRDDEIELTKATKQSAEEQFSPWFDEMIQEERQSRFFETLHRANKKVYVDHINGEIRYL